MRVNVSIGVDLGGTKLAVGVVNNHGVVILREQLPTRVNDGADAIISDIITLIQKMQMDDRFSISNVGIGIPGQVDSEQGIANFVPNLNWTNIPLTRVLNQALRLPIFITNDVRAATYGEWFYGKGKDCNDFVCLFIGTGIGGGIVMDGKMITGSANSAGELGHLTIDLNGPLCTCGNHGCLEAIAGGWAIAKRAQNGIKNKITAKSVIEAAQTGDPLASLIIEEAIQALIAGCVSIVNAFNPKRLILGGGIVKGLPSLRGLLEKGIKKKALKIASADLEVLEATLKEEAGIVGAAAYAKNNN